MSFPKWESAATAALSAQKREFTFDEKGNIVVKNPSAFGLPDVKIVEQVGGTEYTITGSYEDTETLDKS